ncbi:MAG: twin-arginine translocase TatA/TatE family subunit [Gammaproteobacteria bacterium]|nr:twin-arginine translocase TatA/TatE family subunit [Gammaproteobacteria bacterium]
MGFGSVLLILVIVLLLFGTSRLRNMGGDLGSAISNFKKAMRDEDGQKAADKKQVEQKSDAD